jgi:hypothetical protein
MIAGLPGTGIGGIFYLFIALWMPVNEVIKSLRGHANSEDKRLVKKHLFLTLSVIMAVIATGWLAGWLAIMILFGIGGVNQGSGNSAQVENFLQIAPIILTSVTLLAVFLAMHGLRLAMRVHKSLNKMSK